MKTAITKCIRVVLFAIVILVACMASTASAQAVPVDRTVLPLAEPSYPPITELDVRKATPPPRFEVKAPDGAPNVLVILLDNLGFGATKPFGGVIEMPTLERLAKDGLIYNNFHTAPLCSPSRVALLTGRNPHSANMGSIAELATAFPGQTSERPNSVATIAETSEAERLQHRYVRQGPRIHALGIERLGSVRIMAHRLRI